MSEKTNLNRNQQRALNALLTNRTITQAAEAAELNPATLHRYLDDPGFMEAYRAAESEVVNDGIRRLTVLVAVAIDGLANVLGEPTQRGATNRRLAAVAILGELRAFLDQRHKVEDIQELSERIKAMEMEVNKK